VRPPGGAAALAVSADGKTLATAGPGGTLTVWDLASAKEVATLKGHTGDVNAVAFTRDGHVLASGGADKTIRLWDPATGKDLGTLSGHHSEVRALAFTPDGKTLASAGGFEDPKEKNSDFRMKNGELWLWDVPARQGTCVQRHPGGILCLAMSPDGKTVAAGTTMNWNEVLLTDVAQKKAGSPFQTGVGWRSTRAARSWPSARPTTASTSGTWTRTSRSRTSAGRAGRSRAWPSAPTVRRSLPAAWTASSTSGT
jgi:WD40 repeat protein